METNKSAELREIENILKETNKKFPGGPKEGIVYTHTATRNAMREYAKSYHQEQLRKIKEEIEVEKKVIHFYTAKENEVRDDAYNSVIEIIDKYLK